MPEHKFTVARPYALDERTQKLIVESLAAGNYIKVACEAAGTTYECFRHWRSRFEEDDPVAQQFSDFFASVKKALAKAESDGLKDVRVGAPGWQANAWFLERRWPNRWGKKDRTPPKNPDAADDLPDDQLIAAAEEVLSRLGQRPPK